jgi:hypothetical protein
VPRLRAGAGKWLPSGVPAPLWAIALGMTRDPCAADAYCAVIAIFEEGKQIKPQTTRKTATCVG